MDRLLDVEACRAEFPALRSRAGERAAVFFDGPAGSQVPQRVIDAVGACLAETHANVGGRFDASRRCGELLDEARLALAHLLGAPSGSEVVFGPNMTTLTFSLSRALARTWKPGDEVVVTHLDHDANFTPWVLAAEDAGATVRRVAIRAADCTLDLDDLQGKVNERTRLVAVTCASNAVGSLVPIRDVVGVARAAGAQVFLDAVHYAPHARMDVAAWDCDFLVCSAYKFFGPHVGVLWGKPEPLATLPAYQVRPARDRVPGRWMTGTQNHEGIAGTLAAIDYIAQIGRSAAPTADSRPEALDVAFRVINAYERRLAGRLLDGVGRLPAYRVHGITDPDRLHERVPTIAVTHERRKPDELAGGLAARGINVWAGNFYALPLTEALDLEPDGLLRIGLLHYNTAGEVDRLLEALAAME